MKFSLQSEYKPTGDQPQAIDKLASGIRYGLKNQVLLGVTGSGKTFTMANMIQALQMPALIISHNKTLAGQLYQEFRDFFPKNAVSYFVSYYDYYQPEAYIPSSDTYIEKEAEVNEVIDKLRLQSTTNILTRNDTIVVASVSCIYNIGSPTEFNKFMIQLKKGDFIDWKQLSMQLTRLLYERSEFDFDRGTFRMRGNHMDIYLPYQDYGIRIIEEHARIKQIDTIHPLTGETLEKDMKSVDIFPAKLYMTDPIALEQAETQIRSDLEKECRQHLHAGRRLEAERLLRKTNYDLEMLKEVGYVNGIENYSRYFDGRKPGDPPYSLLDYFRIAYGDNFLVFIDESHMTVPQIRGMYNGDHARKKTLIEFGFRLNAAFDNRPLKFEEFYRIPPHLVYVSATPSDWEIEQAQGEVKQKHKKVAEDHSTDSHSGLVSGSIVSEPENNIEVVHNGVVEQLIRPTGIVDPQIDIRPAKTEIPDLIAEIEKRAKKNERVLVTTLTKKTAEDLTEYLQEKEIRAAYLHSDIHTLERSDVLDNLRKNEYDALIGVNLLREGLDLPEVTLVAILDADKEGFLRSETSLVQTMGRAARNIDGTVILYADTITGSIKRAKKEIDRRRKLQRKYNEKHGITPKNVYKPIRERIVDKEDEEQSGLVHDLPKQGFDLKILKDINAQSMTPYDKKKTIKRLEKEMKEYAKDMNFEAAIQIRDKVREMKEL